MPRLSPEEMIEGYRPISGVADEMIAPGGEVRPHWRAFLEELGSIGRHEIGTRFASADRYLREAGVFHRVYDGSGGAERPWPLSHLPLMITADEWRRVSAGLVERAQVLEALLRDLYGAQDLVRDGVLPASAVAGDGGFLRPAVGALGADVQRLWFYAVDLGRGPDGRWWVLDDRTQAPSGAGYAVENRVAMSRALPQLFQRLHIERLAGFFDGLRGGLSALDRREGSRVGLLSPGAMNETYFEHAYLARYLGFLLLEGADLTVRDDIAYVRTASGLRRIEVLWRRIDSHFADPLELGAHSLIGVPGLMRAVRAGNLTVANAIGTGVLEARALLAFLPVVAQRILGRSLALPHVATWWCGQPDALRTVLDAFDDLAIAPAFGRTLAGRADPGPVIGGTLGPREREALREGIGRRPIDFVGQEVVRLSTTPIWQSGRLVPRPFAIRAYVAWNGNRWQVMPGAFCRVSPGIDARALSMQRGDLSADVWVLADAPVQFETLLPPNDDRTVQRVPGALTSRAADNLFWLARYLERTEALVRLARALFSRSTELYLPVSAIRDELVRALAQVSDLGPGSEGLAPMQLLAALSSTETAPAGLHACMRGAIAAATQVRDRLAPDTLRTVLDLQALAIAPFSSDAAEGEVVERANEVLRLCAAFSGFAAENMGRTGAWRFFEMGRRIERAIRTCKLVERFAFSEAPAALDVLLELADSSISYRQRYSITATRLPVCDLVVLDAGNPRAVSFQCARLLEHLLALPGRVVGDVPSDAQIAAGRIEATLRTARASEIDIAFLHRCDRELHALGEALSNAYFLDRVSFAQPMESL